MPFFSTQSIGANRSTPLFFLEFPVNSGKGIAAFWHFKYEWVNAAASRLWFHMSGTPKPAPHVPESVPFSRCCDGSGPITRLLIPHTLAQGDSAYSFIIFVLVMLQGPLITEVALCFSQIHARNYLVKDLGTSMSPDINVLGFQYHQNLSRGNCCERLLLPNTTNRITALKCIVSRVFVNHSLILTLKS